MSSIAKGIKSVAKSTPIEEECKQIVNNFVCQRLPPMIGFKDLLRLYKVRSKKHMSQNFLMSEKHCRKVVKYSKIKTGHRVVEIGPGPGNITRHILERGPVELYVIEKDRRFLPLLEMLADAANPGQMKIIIGDALNFSLANLFPQEIKCNWQDEPPPIHFIGNLPFSVSTPLLIKWLKQIHSQAGPFSYGRVPLSLTFQLEVAERIHAPVLNFQRSRLSVMSQLFCKVERKMNILGKSFYPKPKVDVGLVRFEPLRRPLVDSNIPFEVIEKFIRLLFHLRNAYCTKSLRKLFPPNRVDLLNQLVREGGVDRTDVSYMFSNEEIAKLIQVYWNICQTNPGIFEYNHQRHQKEPQIIKDIFSEKGYRINEKRIKNTKQSKNAINLELFKENIQTDVQQSLIVNKV
jgi:dimethyladenosine transferase, putative